MAGVLTATTSSIGVRSLSLSSENSLHSTFSSSRCYSSMVWSWNPLLRRTTVLLSRKLVIRAARTESKGVSLGFRPPDFELPEPLTGKVWKLDEFEEYPALLGNVHLQSLSVRNTSEEGYRKDFKLLHEERASGDSNFLELCNYSPTGRT
ncbi:hypothetical protein CASFOL_016118 [Castilleja foliolosa]|uniref:Uncharacterized protein n=1 Tax=Castilleja foliolosa TaxID=1961234 RepID=A0ABD3DFN3_9LAMI